MTRIWEKITMTRRLSAMLGSIWLDLRFTKKWPPPKVLCHLKAVTIMKFKTRKPSSKYKKQEERHY